MILADYKVEKDIEKRKSIYIFAEYEIKRQESLS